MNHRQELASSVSLAPSQALAPESQGRQVEQKAQECRGPPGAPSGASERPVVCLTTVSSQDQELIHVVLLLESKNTSQGAEGGWDQKKS